MPVEDTSTAAPAGRPADVGASDVVATLVALSAIPSTSGHEDGVRAYIDHRLRAIGLAPQSDPAGNLIARVPAVPPDRDAEPPLLLNAHMDRVAPGLALRPMLDGDILRGDGTSNLGADDSAGIAIILHTVEALHASERPRPPLLLLFTVGEEVGLVGAKAFDPAPWGARSGIVFDNAGEPGTVVTHAATYIAFDVTLHGHGGHPGKSLDGTTSAIELFHQANYPRGVLDDGETRISIGRIAGGSARNAIPSELHAEGDIRTLRDAPARDALMTEVARAFRAAAEAGHGSASVTFDPHCDGYRVAEDEPLLQAYREVRARRGLTSAGITTFIGSDASALRAHTRVFTVSTGAMDEHTSAEWIAIPPLVGLVESTVDLLATLPDATRLPEGPSATD